MIQIFLADGRTDGLTNGRTEVFHEALADLKSTVGGLKDLENEMKATYYAGGTHLVYGMSPPASWAEYDFHLSF